MPSPHNQSVIFPRGGGGIIHTKAPLKNDPHKSQWISKVVLYLVSQQNPFQIPTNIPSHRWLPELIPTAHPAFSQFRRRRRGSSQADCTLPAARTDHERSAGSAPGSGLAAAWEVSFPAGSRLQVEETADVVKLLEVRMHACLSVYLNLPPNFFYLLTNLFYSSIAFGYADVCECVCVCLCVSVCVCVCVCVYVGISMRGVWFSVSMNAYVCQCIWIFSISIQTCKTLWVLRAIQSQLHWTPITIITVLVKPKLCSSWLAGTASTN